MGRARSPRIAAAVSVAVLLATLAGCGPSGTSAAGAAGAAPTPTAGQTLDDPVPAQVADLPLTDQSGKHVTLASLHGKTVVLVDFLTLCQEICPLTSATLAQADRAVQAASLQDQVVFLEATVDPARDTVPRLAAYQRLWPGHPNWLFATGSPKDLAALWSYFGVSYDKVAEDPGPAPKDWLTGAPLTYDVQHQDIVWIIGPDGHRRWEESGNPDARGQQLPQTLKTFLSDDGRANQASPGPQSWSATDITSAISWVTGKALPRP